MPLRVAEQGSVAAREDGGHPAPPAHEPGVAHYVDALIHAMKSPERQPAFDRSAPDPQLEELPVTDNSVLRAASLATSSRGPI